MENTKFYLGVDGGGSKTTAVVFNEKGEFICKSCGESINYYSRVSFCNRKINRATTSREKPGREFYLFDFVL